MNPETWIGIGVGIARGLVTIADLVFGVAEKHARKTGQSDVVARARAAGYERLRRESDAFYEGLERP